MQFLSHISSRRRKKSMTGLLLAFCLPACWLSSVHATAEKKAADFFVHSLPEAPKGEPLIKMYAGYVSPLARPS
jgi:hypothetical protein